MTYEKKSQIIQSYIATPDGDERFRKLILCLDDLFGNVDIDEILEFTANALAEFVAHKDFETFTEEYRRRVVFDSVSLASKLLRVKDVYEAINKISHREINKMPSNGQSRVELSEGAY